MSVDWNLLKNKTYVVVDLETTGLMPNYAKITEIGAIKIVDGKMVQKFHTLIDPEVKIPKNLVEKIGITDEMVAGKPKYEEVLPAFYQFIEGATIICHNANFDWNRFLTYFFNKLGMYPKNDVLDTMKIFKSLYPEVKKANLAKMCETLQVPLGTHHRALNDAMVTGYCFLKMQQKAVDMMKEGRLETSQVQKTSPIVSQSATVGEVYPKASTFVVMANYWEKAISKKTTYRRIYVSLRDGQIYGRVYLDLTNKKWYNKDFPHNLDFDKVAQQTVRFMNLENVEALMTYKKA